MPVDSIQRIKVIVPIADTIHDTLRVYIHDTIPSVIYVVGKGQDDIWGVSTGNLVPSLIGGVLTAFVAVGAAYLTVRWTQKQNIELESLKWKKEERDRHLTKKDELCIKAITSFK